MAENLPDTNVGNIKYIRRQDVVDEINVNADGLEQNGGIPYAQGARAMAIVVEQMPPADVVEVVRCKECKYWAPGYPTYYGDDFIVPECGKYKQMVGCSGDDFCSYGERREE